MDILLCNDHLNRYAGSEIHCLELAEHLKDQGHNVQLATFHTRQLMGDEFRQRQIEIVAFTADGVNRDWDVIWTHQVTCFTEIHVRRRLRARRHIHGLLSSVLPADRVPIPAGASPPEPGFRLLANAPLTRDAAAASLPADILWNLAPERWCRAPSRRRDRLENIIVVSNHPPEEVRELKAVAERKGLGFRIIGRNDEVALVTPELLATASAVISIGKTVHYCLAAGIPVFVYDRFGGPGWLTTTNIEAAEYAIYSGKCTRTQLTAQALFGAVTNGFADACRFQLARREWAAQRYGVGPQLARLRLLELGPKPRRLLNNPATRRAVAGFEREARRIMRSMPRDPFREGWLG